MVFLCKVLSIEVQNGTYWAKKCTGQYPKAIPQNAIAAPKSQKPLHQLQGLLKIKCFII
jgi:hypothetical protein